MFDSGDYWWIFTVLQCISSTSDYWRHFLSNRSCRVCIRRLWGRCPAYQETSDCHSESGGDSWRRSAQVLLSAGTQVPLVEGCGCDDAGAVHVLPVLHRLSRRRAATFAARKLPSEPLHRYLAPAADSVAFDSADCCQPRCPVPRSPAQRNSRADRATGRTRAAASNVVDVWTASCNGW